MGTVLSVNVASRAEAVPYKHVPSGIGKQPVTDPVEVRDPGPKRGGLGSGLVGDVIGDQRHHGGSDQAVYAYSRESLDGWERALGRDLPAGWFGENLTTEGLDVDGAVLGERWRIGSTVVLQVSSPRIPCGTFRGRMGEPGWLRRFADAARPGAYLRVVVSGTIQAGDPITVIDRPDHGVSIALMFRAVLREPALLPQLAAAGADLSEELRSIVASGKTFTLDP